MEEYKEVFQLTCTVFTIGFFSTGILTCLKIRREKSVNNVNFLPYVMTSLNCLLWFEYGLWVNDSTLCLVNGTGGVLQFMYIIIYLRHCKNSSLLKYNLCLTGAAAAIFGLISVIVYQKSKYSDQTNNLGLTCDVVTILMFASPLSTLGKVIQTKNTSTLSFPLSFMVILVSASWFFYGAILGDYFVMIPNIIGAGLGTIQLGLFYIYPFISSKTEL